MKNGLKPSDKEIVKRLVMQEHEMFPMAIAIDYYKSIYQAFNGPNHFFNKQSYNYLLNEIQNNPQNNYPVIVDLSGFHELWRVNTIIVNQGIISIDKFADVHFATCARIGTNLDNWVAFKRDTSDTFFSLLDSLNVAEIQPLKDDFLNHVLLVNHSKKYHDYYNPHYRLIDPNLFSDKIKNEILEINKNN